MIVWMIESKLSTEEVLTTSSSTAEEAAAGNCYSTREEISFKPSVSLESFCSMLEASFSERSLASI